MKTSEELKELKKEYESLTSKLKELSEEEMELVTGGLFAGIPEEHNVMLTGDFVGNNAYGSSGKPKTKYDE